MKLPEDIRQLLIHRFRNKHREWLMAKDCENQWPLGIALGIPTEQSALHQIEGVKAWVTAWQSWNGIGLVSWCERHWKSLGIQRLPAKLILQKPEDVAMWIGETARWQRASARFQALTASWPALAQHLPRYFDIMADYTDSEFQRLSELLRWISANPNSNFYPRQLPVVGVDSKWTERRKGLLTDLVAVIQGDSSNDLNFYQRCGLKAPPLLIRMRVLDPILRNRVGGISDITAPIEDIADSNFPASQVFIIENLQTGLALPDMSGAVAFMCLGYSVDVLARLPWITQAKCIYWGDLDTHGFAILHRARSYLSNLQSILMDEDTLLSHRALWVQETEQHSASELSLLTEDEQAVYLSLKQQRWGHNIRLEQERLAWDYALKKLQHSIVEH